LRNINSQPKYLIFKNIKQEVKNINAYLLNSSNIIISRRNSCLSKFPNLPKGNMPYDGGFLIFTKEEMEEFIVTYPNSSIYFKKLVGAKEYINDIERWCLWIRPNEFQTAIKIKGVFDRIEKVKELRLNSPDTSARKLAERAYQFREVNETKRHSIIIPLTTSERREYIPMGFIYQNTIATNASSVLYDCDFYLFSILISKIHMIWMRTFAGRLKSDYRYSSDLVYNNFPFPPITKAQKEELEQHTHNILKARANHTQKTLAEMYDPNKMPEDLRQAHQANDLAVEKCYRNKPFESDEERLAYLFNLYEIMIAEEKDKGTLFALEPKVKPTKKAKKK
jgi:CRISPR/Cas system CSM-associated protein Csm4 (group 5 of RAMP superfamily)